MFRPLAAFVLAAALLAEPALAASPVEQAFGNTIVSTYPDGRTAKLWLNADGTYSAVGRRRKPSSGTWTLKGEKICLKQLKPLKAPFSYCTGISEAKVGASWKGKAVTGEPISIKLVKGRV